MAAAASADSQQQNQDTSPGNRLEFGDDDIEQDHKWEPPIENMLLIEYIWFRRYFRWLIT